MGPKRFAGSVTGDNSTENSRYGNQLIEGHIRGWASGIRVRGFVSKDDKDEFEIWTTGGSNNTKDHKLVARVVAGRIYEVGLVSDGT